MHLDSLMAQICLVMVAAVIAVPIFKRLGLGAVLGYLAAGVVVGPSVFNVVGHVDEVMHIAELGVVFFLFLVGLELQPARLWELRRGVFGLGTAQVMGTVAVLTGVGVLAGLSVPAALVAAMGLSLSSTAIALRVLAERGISSGPAGQSGFAMLLFQDLAVVPLLAIIPVLAGQSTGGFADIALNFAKVVGMVALLLVGGRLAVRPVFRFLARTGVHEISTVVALLVVVGAGLAMTSVGLSMAMGAFLAGVLLADSEYRHELEAAIDPFKGILLGLFFMAIGMSANLALAAERPVAVLSAVVVVVVVKGILLMGILRFAPGAGLRERALVGAALSQGGEFGFVLFGVAAGVGVVDAETKDFLVVVVSLSMATTPLVLPVAERLAKLWEARHPTETDAPGGREFDVIDEEAPIIIAGFGRFGQIVSRTLLTAGHRFTALEVDVDHVDFVRKYGNKIYYGDASHLDLLRAAGIERARAFVLAVDDLETSVKIATIVRGSFPTVPIYARARNRQHVFALMDLGVTIIQRETLHSSLKLAELLLTDLDGDAEEARRVVDAFLTRDEGLLQQSFLVHHDEKEIIQTARQAGEELRAIFEAETRRRRERVAGGTGRDPVAASARVDVDD